MNILLLTAHSILEYDELRIFHDLGHSVLSIGAYLDPANPSDDKRPALPDVPLAPAELRALVTDQMAVKSDLPDEVLEWADTVICHFFTVGAPDGRAGWLSGNWAKFKAHRNRVIWRAAGQSNHVIEELTQPLRDDGLEIVRYSPRERNIPYFCGEDALIRFGKYPDDWDGWSGEDARVANVTQNMVQRGDACGYTFWQHATAGLPMNPAGPGSEAMGGAGSLSYEAMQTYLRAMRVYLYTGTHPAPYTLGLMEAMLAGTPVVSIGPRAFGGTSYVADMFEGHEIAGPLRWHDDPQSANAQLREILNDPAEAQAQSRTMRERAVLRFSVADIKPQWARFLG